jgi:hypothetical protein
MDAPIESVQITGLRSFVTRLTTGCRIRLTIISFIIEQLNERDPWLLQRS